MELRLFPTHREAVEAFDRERGRGHDFRRLEVLRGDGSRVKFASIDSLRNAEVLLGMTYSRVWVSENCDLARRRQFLALIKSRVRENGPDETSPAA